MNTNWRARIDRFYPASSQIRSALKLAAAFFGASFLLLIPAAFLDMDGHDTAEEPIRAYLYQSMRAFFMTIFELPCRLGEHFVGLFGRILGVFITLVFLAAIPIAFGFTVTALFEWRRRAAARRVAASR